MRHGGRRAAAAVLLPLLAGSARADWTYAAPAAWGGSCGGSMQSPIDVTTANVIAPAAAETLSGHMAFAPVAGTKTENVHGTIKVHGEPPVLFGTTTVDGAVYNAAQLHFHFPSEHTINGVHSVGEVHIVHTRAGSVGYEDVLVIGIMLKDGAQNAFLESLMWTIPGLPAAEGGSVAIATNLDLKASFLPQLNGAFYRYDGSLTTPPCTETVKWYLMATPADVSAAQAQLFKNLFPDPANNRPVQPVNGRHIVQTVGAVPHTWGYTSPWDNTDWAHASATCGNGQSQSPINIVTDTANTVHDPKILRNAMAFNTLTGRTMTNTGHNIQVSGNFGTTTIDGKVYNAVQIHFHFPSEHTINGVHAEGEVHIVHAAAGSTGNEDLLVIGVLLEVSPDEHSNPFLTLLGFDGHLPVTPHSERAVDNPVSVAGAFDSQLAGDFYRYDGSLTTPPCAETVRWYVLAKTAPVSTAQVNEFKALYPNPWNNRPTQPLNDRLLMKNSWAVYKPTPVPTPAVTAGTHPGWGYTAPWDNTLWVAESAMCGSGLAQSPVDIHPAAAIHAQDFGAAVAQLGTHSTWSPKANLIVENDGHAIHVAGDHGHTTIAGAQYDAYQLHFHFPSEHTFNGLHAAGEMHIVHKRHGTEGATDLLVIAVLFDIGAASGFLDALGWGALPAQHQHHNSMLNVPLNLGDFAGPLGGDFYHYRGSLTTPPCAETVKWYVTAGRATVSQAQSDAFKALFPNPWNYRPTQPLNGRPVYLNSLHTHAWGYTSPWDNTLWAYANHMCDGLRFGSRQSPIDIHTAGIIKPVHSQILSTAMSHVATPFLVVENTGHGIQVESNSAAPLALTTVDDWQYNAVQFNFHFPSEHAINGHLAAGEMHIVHKRLGFNGYEDLLVVAVQLEVGAENEFLQDLQWINLPHHNFGGNTRVIQKHLDVAASFAAQLGGDYFRYDGSLTTPPCSETVKWYVMAAPATVSQAQIDEFRALYPNPPGNNRPTQPRNNRPVWMNSFYQVHMQPSTPYPTVLSTHLNCCTPQGGCAQRNIAQCTSAACCRATPPPTLHVVPPTSWPTLFPSAAVPATLHVPVVRSALNSLVGALVAGCPVDSVATSSAAESDGSLKVTVVLTCLLQSFTDLSRQTLLSVMAGAIGVPVSRLTRLTLRSGSVVAQFYVSGPISTAVTPVAQPIAPVSGTRSGLGTYPGYTGVLRTSGSFVVSPANPGMAAADSLLVEWVLSNADPLCNRGAAAGVANSCGIHIHQGTSCSVASAIGGTHYQTVADPWTDKAYVADVTGADAGSFTIFTGYTAAQALGHAMVVHDSFGARIACGIVGTASSAVLPYVTASPTGTDDDDDSTLPPWAIALIVIGCLCCCCLCILLAYLVSKKKKQKGEPPKEFQSPQPLQAESRAPPPAPAQQLYAPPQTEPSYTYASKSVSDSGYDYSEVGANFPPGAEVQALYIDGAWYHAWVDSQQADGTYTIRWDDGSISDSVPGEQIAYHTS